MAHQIKVMEETMPKYIDYIFTLSSIDEKYFASKFPEKTYNIPVNFTINSKSTNKMKNTIVHLGAMDWKPNKEGMNWFINNVFPRIKKMNQKIKIHIAGKGMPKHYFNYNDKKICKIIICDEDKTLISILERAYPQI